ncbi:MAG TPA: S8 family peptidase [Candidatus Eisenbergiella merdipullorum]|uniref:S8 family peptidase n=1 Tax=Candidatus Eisenbergiella merdipullorum TaxID=2838553 RepID=A0A9D2L296_9FIRM|nr:S8 family peptidase [Candidatus Eisenbergiella merdipullorum]
MTCRDMILSEDFQDFLTYYILPEGTLEEEVSSDAFCFVPVSGRLWSVYFNRENLPPLSFSGYQYRYVTELYGLADDFVWGAQGQSFDPQPLIKSGIVELQGEPLTLTGRNVVIGFADTGIDYRNPVFRRQDGSSRILAIWDQTDQTGTPPEGFYYGSEYTREQINAALSLENPLEAVPVTDENGHGTRMASAAAGSAVNGGLDFLGAAPDADIVVVKLKQAKQYLLDFYLIPEGVPAYESNDIVLAVKYLNSFAVPFVRPLCICLGIGRSFGDHRANSALSRYLSEVGSDINRVVVVSGGNEGNSAHHYAGTIIDRESEDIELRVGEGTKGFLMEIWGNLPSYFAVMVRSPGGEEIPVISSRLEREVEYSFVYGRTRIRIDYQLNDLAAGGEVAVLRLEEPAAGVWTFRLVQEAEGYGAFHMWLPLRQFVEGTVEFLRPSPDTTLTSPSYAQDVLAVSAYNSRNNSFYVNSGRGFALDGRIKPELTAPGVDISVAAGRLQGSALIGTASGTSLAAAITAGACAQLFQWCVPDQNYPDINGTGLINFLVRGAARDASQSYPNRTFGFGRLDVAGVFDWLAGIMRG